MNAVGKGVRMGHDKQWVATQACPARPHRQATDALFDEQAVCGGNGNECDITKAG